MIGETAHIIITVTIVVPVAVNQWYEMSTNELFIGIKLKIEKLKSELQSKRIIPVLKN